MKLIMQITIDFFIWIGIIFGLYNGVGVIENIATFALWFMAIIGLIAGLLGGDEFKQHMKDEKISRPDSAIGRYTLISSIIESLAIAGAGYYTLATVYAISTILIAAKKQSAIDEQEASQ